MPNWVSKGNIKHLAGLVDRFTNKSAGMQVELARSDKPAYVIVPGRCASACPDTLDVFLVEY